MVPPPSPLVLKPPPAPVSDAGEGDGHLSSAVETSGSGNNSQVEEGEKKLLLQVKDLTAVIAESKQEILKGVNFTVYQGEVLAGHPEYEVTGGSVVFKGENLLEMAAEDRSLSGLFMSFQSPVEIPGVTNIDFLNMAYNARRKKLGLPELGPIEFYAYIFPKLDLVNMKTDFLNRNVNEGFSGGEKKRNEILQLAEDGKIVKTGNISLAEVLEKEGYKAISAA
ncbi:ABC transporter I family member 6, chloroplastic [Prunus dulcis]|uniref:ABC transporter I family member 6, chloroplastic n=1 Tax=Prunus dulcis TaxID=3755 RepID=A0A4Y1QY94_PRUDU|nr:ABC transporter I family member 6, chloroplastic [Prunus dulcis]